MASTSDSHRPLLPSHSASGTPQRERQSQSGWSQCPLGGGRGRRGGPPGTTSAPGCLGWLYASLGSPAGEGLIGVWYWNGLGVWHWNGLGV